MRHPERRPAVFLDRDGTLMVDRGYLADPKGVRLYAGVPGALRRLRRAGYRLVVVTNQSGVARGYFPESAVGRVNGALQAKLKAKGAGVDAFYHCPHYPGAPVRAYARRCACRKPAPGMVRRAAREMGLDLKRSYMIGDKPDDLRLAKRAGLAGALLVRTGQGRASERELKGRDVRFKAVPGLARAAGFILAVKERP